VSKIEMWTAPLFNLIVREGEQTLDAGDELDLVLGLPGQPVLRCVLLSLEDESVALKLDGFVRGLATWHLVSSGKDVIIHTRVRYNLADDRWLVPWALAGRWVGALTIAWLLRRLKARVEDSVGSSRFGVPLLVSPYAVIGVMAVLGACLGWVGLRVARWFQPRGGADD
jgi:hypothetical protein